MSLLETIWLLTLIFQNFLSVTDEGFREFFQSHGNVIDSVVMVDRETGRSRGFGFVTFEDEATAEKLLGGKNCLTNTITIQGKLCEVKAAEPKLTPHNSAQNTLKSFDAQNITRERNVPVPQCFNNNDSHTPQDSYPKWHNDKAGNSEHTGDAVKGHFHGTMTPHSTGAAFPFYPTGAHQVSPHYAPMLPIPYPYIPATHQQYSVGPDMIPYSTLHTPHVPHHEVPLISPNSAAAVPFPYAPYHYAAPSIPCDLNVPFNSPMPVQNYNPYYCVMPPVLMHDPANCHGPTNLPQAPPYVNENPHDTPETEQQVDNV